MIARSVGWQELMLLASCFITIPFIAGLVMFIVGLSLRKRGLWIAGLVMALIPMALILLAVAAALLARLA